MEEGEEFHQGFLVPEHHSTGSWEIRTLLMMCERTIHTLELSFFVFLFFFQIHLNQLYINSRVGTRVVAKKQK